MALLDDELAASRLLRRAAEYPTCNTDRSKWPSDVAAACSAEAGSLIYRTYSTNAMIQLCKSPACMRIEAIMKADNPAECVYLWGASYLLYDGTLNPLDETCRLVSGSKDTDPLVPATTVSPQPAATPSPSAKTSQPQPQPPAATPTTKKPSSSMKPGSSGGNGDGSSTEGDGSSASPPESGADSSSAGARSPTSRTKAPSSSTVSPSSPASSSSSSASSAANANDLFIASTSAPATTKPSGIQPNASPSTTGSSSNSSHTGLVAGLSLAAVVVLVVVWAVVRKCRRKRLEIGDASSAMKLGETNANTTHDSEISAVREHFGSFAPLLQQLNNWKIDSCELVDVKMIGSGAQGSVHLVALDGSRQLASKRLITDQLTQQRLTSFVAEIELVATLKHPTIVQFVGVAWTTIADLQALFEYMPNGDLRTHLDTTKPPQPEPWTHHKLKMALQIAEGLVYVHSFNPPIVHRDLKARNILLDADMNAKLSDFGVSRFQSEQGTMTTGIGTSRWLAPEVIMGGGMYTEQCDIYSFGVVLTEVDTHDLPFADEKIPEIELLHRVGTGTLRARTSSQCDPRIRELIEQCLCVNPSDRPNALELTYRLRKILKS